MNFNLEKIISEIKTLTTGIYYNQLQELLDYIVEIPYEDRKKYKIICKEVVYRECKRIADYFRIDVLKANYLPENDLICCINFYELEKYTTNYILNSDIKECE